LAKRKSQKKRTGGGGGAKKSIGARIKSRNSGAEKVIYTSDFQGGGDRVYASKKREPVSGERYEKKGRWHLRNPRVSFLSIMRMTAGGTSQKKKNPEKL